MRNIILFGAPGSGKGTQSKILVQKYNLFHISTGDILRNEIANNSELGKIAKAIVDAGKLVSDDIVDSLVESTIAKNKDHFSGFIFDGFPRTCEQAITFNSILKKFNAKIFIVIYLDVPIEERIKRVEIRSHTSHRNDDNDINIINARVKEYIEKTEPVLKYYKGQGLYRKVIGTGTIEEINSRICEAIDAIIPS